MTVISCPTCGGPVELAGDRPDCLIGHEFEKDDLEIQVSREAARALWAAVRALEDSASAASWRLTKPSPPPHLQATITKARREADLIRELLRGREDGDPVPDPRPTQE